MAAVLFVGTAGVVYGADFEEDTSSITLNTTDDRVEVNYVNYTDGDEVVQYIIAGNEQGTNFGYSEANPANTADGNIAFHVNITVYSDDMTGLQNATVRIFYTGGGAVGAAIGEFFHTWENDTWDGTSEILTHDFTTDIDDTFLRYGDWDIEVKLHDNLDVVLDSESFSEALDVQTYISISAGVADVTGSVEPGQSIGTYELGAVSFDPAEPTISFETNALWEIEMLDTQLTGPGDPIDAATETYNETTGDPGDFTLEVRYLYNVPEGQLPGVYSTTVTHRITNTEAP